MGRLPSVVVYFEGVCAIENFKLIEIIDDRNLYPALLGFNWDFDNKAIINMKRRHISFENGDLSVFFPLDPWKGVCYTEPDRDEYCDTYIENIYNIKTK